MIRYIVLDVDGTLTDGKIYMSPRGEVMKAFNVKDGYGIHEVLPRYDITPVVVTGRKSSIVEKRCAEIGIKQIYQGVVDKTEVISKVTNDLSEMAYIGDDLNDINCMKLVKEGKGILGCPADAVEEVMEISDYVTKRNGGDGAVREFIDWIIRLQRE